jgi:hypothetical protein
MKGKSHQEVKNNRKKQAVSIVGDIGSDSFRSLGATRQLLSPVSKSRPQLSLGLDAGAFVF